MTQNIRSILPLELCLKLKQAGFNLPTRDCYFQRYTYSNFSDPVRLEWKFYETPILCPEDHEDLPGILPEGYSADVAWKWFLDETWNQEWNANDACVDYETTERDWNIDLFEVILRMLYLNDLTKDEIKLLKYLVINAEEYEDPEFDFEDWIFETARIFLSNNEISYGSETIVDMVMSFITTEDSGSDDIKMIPDYKKTIFVDTVDFPIFPIPGLCSAPSIQEVMIWLDQLGIHLCTNYNNGVWEGYLAEHPSTKSSMSSYMECMWDLIDSAIDYLNIIK